MNFQKTLTMHFSKIYIQDNFVPDYATDPYRRKVIGVEVTLNDDDKIEQAKELAEQYVKEYILANKIESPHIVERYIPEPTVLPSIQVEKEGELSLEQQIESCTQLSVLDSYHFIISKKRPDLFDLFSRKRHSLLSSQNF